MYIARILYPVEVLGPGKRIGIWFCGCPHRCNGCSNPELWEQTEQYQISLRRLLQLIKEIEDNNRVDGFTITGGEPFYQPGALLELVTALHTISNDILIYSGYTLSELNQQDNPVITKILAQIAVLIDGRYIESRNNGVVLRGSDNQKILILDAGYKAKYNEFFKIASNLIQNFISGDSVISVGIHHPGYSKELEVLTLQKGLEEIK